MELLILQNGNAQNTTALMLCFCKINQKSSLPNGEWEDDYYILYVPCEVVHKSLGDVVIDEYYVELMKRDLTDSTSVIVRHEDELKEVNLSMVEFD